MPKFKKGDQVAYIPTHADGDTNHPDVEYGFVTSVKGDTVYCRYWAKYWNGLRTRSCSEGTPRECLVKLKEYRPQAQVERWIERFEKESDASTS